MKSAAPLNLRAQEEDEKKRNREGMKLFKYKYKT